MVSVKPAISEKQIVSFFRWLAILTSWRPVNIERYTCGGGRLGWTIGALMLAFVWSTYNMYLGPRGLPLDQPYYSGYRDLWWLSFPGGSVSALIGWWVGGWLMKKRRVIGVVGIGMLAVCWVSLSNLPTLNRGAPTV
ncbi:hypothetical protein [Mesorhizobium sp. M0488]|uniref:hypothetical protein n=1 Tax=Mesorhizobium sp. M0488 TaxID=2956949 RepID=UPI003337647E